MNDTQMNGIIDALMIKCGFGALTGLVKGVNGGFLHRMFRAETEKGVFAVKCLNAEIMNREGVMENYRRAERLERLLEEAGIPLVPAWEIAGEKMQKCQGRYFYIFRWQEGSITDWNRITEEMCAAVGNILGRIHALQPEETACEAVEQSRIDWQQYADEATQKGNEIAPWLEKHLVLLAMAEEKMNRARICLPAIRCISNADMDPKNVMWHEGKPKVIDLECLDYGNPVSDAFQLALQWAGIVSCSLDTDKMIAFFEGYRKAYDPGFGAYSQVLGLAYTWVEWLEYNVQRALGKCADEAERQMGISEVCNTIERIKYIREKEESIKKALDAYFR